MSQDNETFLSQRLLIQLYIIHLVSAFHHLIVVISTRHALPAFPITPTTYDTADCYQ